MSFSRIQRQLSFYKRQVDFFPDFLFSFYRSFDIIYKLILSATMEMYSSGRKRSHSKCDRSARARGFDSHLLRWNVQSAGGFCRLQAFSISALLPYFYNAPAKKSAPSGRGFTLPSQALSVSCLPDPGLPEQSPSGPVPPARTHHIFQKPGLLRDRPAPAGQILLRPPRP